MAGMDYQKVMDGLARIPGLDLKIPGMTKQGYKPNEVLESRPAPDFGQLYIDQQRRGPVQEDNRQEPQRRFQPKKVERRKPLSKEDKRLFLAGLKEFYDRYTNDQSNLNESSDILQSMESIVVRNPGNLFLEKTYHSLLEAASELDLARGHLKMVIKNTAEFIKSM